MKNAIERAGAAGFWRRAVGAVLVAVTGSAGAAVGLDKIEGREGDGPVTVFYPSSSPSAPVRRGPFTLDVAEKGAPVRGNGRLVVISHGSGGTPTVYADLARVLVDAGFVVAAPEHRGDNALDPGTPGPESWKLRPAEVSRAIDAVAMHPRFGALVNTDSVGVYGMSAGGHTVLTLAGGQWSPAGFSRYCETHIADDFPFCVGLAAQLNGNWFDGVKKFVARMVIGAKFDHDAGPYTYSDPRIVAVVAGVPAAADFDMASLATPRIPVGLVTAAQDKWLAPRYHSDAVLAACKSCELVAALPTGGHGALLSPLPPALPERAAALLNDPPGFDRALLPEVDRKITAFFVKHVLRGDLTPMASAAAAAQALPTGSTAPGVASAGR